MLTRSLLATAHSLWEVSAQGSAMTTSKGICVAGVGGSCRLYACSEATFQDDVVAIIALSCKRKNMKRFTEGMVFVSSRQKPCHKHGQRTPSQVVQARHAAVRGDITV